MVDEQILLNFGDEFDEVAELIDAAISVASQDQLLPTEFPRNAIQLFTGFRKKTHGCLAEWMEATFKNLADVIGEVSIANVHGDTLERYWRPDAVAMPTTSSQPAVWGLSTGRRRRCGASSATTGAVAGGR